MRVVLAIALFLSACGNKQNTHSQSSTDTTNNASIETVQTASPDTLNQVLNPSQIIGVAQKMGAFEVAQNDLPSMLVWDQAKTSVEMLGTGWRLPTTEELQIIYKNKDSIGGFAVDVYWTSEETSAFNARTINFSSGKPGSFSKIYNARIRAVRSI